MYLLKIVYYEYMVAQRQIVRTTILNSAALNDKANNMSNHSLDLSFE